jgi:hypothetical protein
MRLRMMMRTTMQRPNARGPVLLRRLVIAITFLLFAVSPSLVFADPVSPIGVQVLATGGRQLSLTSNGSTSAQGGNVTNINIDALTITKTWQGYYGNVTGNIHLDDANNNSFYVWGNGTSLSGQIYASRNSSINWSGVTCTTGAQRLAEETYLGVASTDGDSVVNTFNKTTHPGFNIGLNPIAADNCFSTYGLVNGSTQNSTFSQILLSDNVNSTIYATLIAYREYGYNGLQMDFQLLVGENEHVGNQGPTPYYFFVELN